MLDGIGMKAVLLSNEKHAANRADKMLNRYNDWSGYPFNAIYDPSMGDEGFAAKLLKGLVRKLEARLIRERE